MYLGKTLFAQIMDFLPWKTFHRIVDRYSGDYRTRSLSCAEQFRVMAFAQLTYRESLRDIEVCLAAQAGKLYHMGIGAAVARSTLADANESRDWRIYFELAQRLIIKARALYVDEDFGVELACIMQRFALRGALARFSDDATEGFRLRRRAFSAPAAWPEFEAGGVCGLTGEVWLSGRHAPPLRWRDAGLFRARSARCPVRNTMSANEP